MPALRQVLPSIAARLGLADLGNHLSLPAAHRYIVLLIDGLGWVQLQEFARHAPFLGFQTGEPLQAEFPTTTAVGLASLGTGLPAGQHGLVGASFWVPEAGRILTPLHWPDDLSPQLVQPEPTIFERLGAHGVSSACVGSAKYRDTGLTRAVLRGATYVSAEDAASTVDAVQGGSWSCTYVYWSALDRAGHQHGVGSPPWLAALGEADALARRLHESVRDAVLVVTADHGMVNARERISLDGHPLLSANIRHIAGEPRLRHVYLRDPSDQRTRMTWQEVLAPCADVRDRQAALELFESVTADVVDRIGDLVCLPKPGWLLTAPVDARLGDLPGQHGGLTDEERLIPGIVLAG